MGPGPPRDPQQGPLHAEQLFPEVYDYLRALAHRYFRAGRGTATLEPTGLVHEAYVRLSGGADGGVRFRDREHFCAIAAQAMRRILIDHCRRRMAAKRDGGERITLSGLGTPGEGSVEDILTLDASLAKLARRDARMARVVEMRVFGGMTGDEIARDLAVSRRTVDTDWRSARAWLASEMGPGWRFD